MDRINGEDWIDIVGGRRGFKAQNAAAGITRTQITDEFLTGIQEEVLNVVKAAKITPNSKDRSQLLQAINIIAKDYVKNISVAPPVRKSAYKPKWQLTRRIANKNAKPFHKH